MKIGGSEINLFHYLDYRKFLKDYYQTAKKTRAGFSLRMFSKKAGFTSSNFFKLVKDGDRNLTEKSVIKFMRGLELNKQEQDFFKNLVHFTQAQSHQEKDFYYKKLLQSQKFNNIKPLEKQQYEFYSTWYHSVVRELIASSEFDGSLKWLAQKIRPEISEKEIEKSIRLLENLGFICQTSDGRWKQTSPLVSTGDECQSLILLNYHKSLLSLAKNQLDKIPPHLRDVSALTLGIDKKLLPHLKKRIQEFRKDILKMVADQDLPNEVVVLSMQLLPVTNHEGEI